jgi:hypothetical protein
VYDELRRLAAQKLAQEKPGQTLQATALVHEAYLRVVGAEVAQHWNSKGHFFGVATQAMRRILHDEQSGAVRGRARRGGAGHAAVRPREGLAQEMKPALSGSTWMKLRPEGGAGP